MQSYKKRLLRQVLSILKVDAIKDLGFYPKTASALLSGHYVGQILPIPIYETFQLAGRRRVQWWVLVFSQQLLPTLACTLCSIHPPIR